MSTHAEDRRVGTTKLTNSSSLRRRWTDADENIETIDAESIAHFSEQAIRSLRQRSLSLGLTINKREF